MTIRIHPIVGYPNLRIREYVPDPRNRPAAIVLEDIPFHPEILRRPTWKEMRLIDFIWRRKRWRSVYPNAGGYGVQTLDEAKRMLARYIETHSPDTITQAEPITL